MVRVWKITLSLCLIVYLTQCNSEMPSVFRLCNGDYTTEGKCIVAINQGLDWHAADLYCRNQLPRAGYLVAIEDQPTQDLVAAEVVNQGWDKAWINGFRGHRHWHWQKHNKFLAYQGCYKDVEGDSDLQKRIFLTPNQRPSDCLHMCDEEFAGIQLDENRRIMCFCGWEYGKHGRSNSPQCDTPCPGSLEVNSPVNLRCGGPGFQLIYHVNGTRYNGFPSPLQTDGECAVFDRNSFGHPWGRHNCHEELPFICEYIYLNEKDCIEFNTVNKWVAGRCISIETEARDFYQAQEYCSTYNALLLKVNSEEVNQAVVQLLDSDKSYFIALTNEQWLFSLEYYEDIYKYFNWGPRQPDYGEGQDCLKISANKWYNYDCDTILPFVCMVAITDSASLTTTTGSTSLTTPEAPLTTTTNTSDDLIGGLPKNLVIGLAAGGGGIVLIGLLTLLICCVIRKRKQKKLHGRNMHSDKRHHRRNPRDPQRLNKMAASAISNPAYQPQGRGVGRSGHSQASYEEVGSNPGYQGLGDRSTDSHGYDRMRSKSRGNGDDWGDDYNYIDPTESSKTYRRY